MTITNEEFRNKLLNKSFDFSNKLVKFITTLPKNEVFRVTNDQVLRSGLSIGANISEAQGGSSRNDFKNFIQHAYKSSIETRYWLAVIEKSEFTIDRKMLLELVNLVRELSKILISIIRTLKSKL